MGRRRYLRRNVTDYLAWEIRPQMTQMTQIGENIDEVVRHRLYAAVSLVIDLSVMACEKRKPGGIQAGGRFISR